MSDPLARWHEFLVESLPGMGAAKVGLLRATLEANEVSLGEWLSFKEKKRTKIAPLPSAAERELPRRIAELERMANHGVTERLWLLGPEDFQWPGQALQSMGEKAPRRFVGWGNARLLESKLVAVVGSREITEEQSQVAEITARSLVEMGLGVISGGARGVDQAAHQAALANGGQTVFVLPEGLAQTRLIEEMESHSSEDICVISTVWPMQPWSTLEALARNSVIASLAMATVVIAAKTKGGSVTTGMASLDMGRPTLAIDYGSVTVHSAGNHRLIQSGATPLDHESYAEGHAPDTLRAALGIAAKPKPMTGDLFGDLET